MKQIWHIVMKDGYRLRWRLALWLVVLVAKTVFGFVLLRGTGPGPLAKHAYGINAALVGLDMAFCYLLAVMLVQEDLLVGTRAFLLTRPVSGGRLLAAKLLAAFLLFGLVPVLIWLPWWLHCGYGARELTWAVAETWFWQAAVVLPAMLIAAVTDSVGRVLLWSLTVLAGTPLVLMMVGTWTMHQGPILAAQLIGVVLVGVIVAVVRQYFLRQTGRSLAMLMVTTGVLMVAIHYWPRGNTGQPAGLAPPSENAVQAKGVTMEFGRSSAQASGRKLGNLWQGVSSEWKLRGLPEDLMLVQGTVKESWQWGDGPVFTMSGISGGQEQISKTLFRVAEREPDAETERHYVELRKGRRSRPQGTEQTSADARPVRSYGMMARSLIARLAREPATCVAEGRFTLARPEIWYDEPIAGNTWRAHLGMGLRVGVAVWDGRMQFIEVCTQAVVGPEALEMVAFLPSKVRPEHSFAYDALWERVINRQKGYVISPLRAELCDPVRVGTVVIRWRNLWINTPRVWRQNYWVMRDKDWFEDARLVAVGANEVGEFTCEATTDRFTVALPDERK